jgi:hypothetical protein
MIKELRKAGLGILMGISPLFSGGCTSGTNLEGLVNNQVYLPSISDNSTHNSLEESSKYDLDEERDGIIQGYGHLRLNSPYDSIELRAQKPVENSELGRLEESLGKLTPEMRAGIKKIVFAESDYKKLFGGECGISIAFVNSSCPQILFLRQKEDGKIFSLHSVPHEATHSYEFLHDEKLADFHAELSYFGLKRNPSLTVIENGDCVWADKKEELTSLRQQKEILYENIGIRKDGTVPIEKKGIYDNYMTVSNQLADLAEQAYSFRGAYVSPYQTQPHEQVSVLVGYCYSQPETVRKWTESFNKSKEILTLLRQNKFITQEVYDNVVQDKR